MLGTFYSSDSVFQQLYEVTVITHGRESSEKYRNLAKHTAYIIGRTKVGEQG